MRSKLPLATAALGAVVLLLPAWLLSDYQVGVLTLVVSFAVAALAQNLLSGYADIPSLGNVAFFAASAYTGAGLITLARWPEGLALATAVLAAAGLGLVVGLPALRISGMHLAIVTVALVFVSIELMTQFDANHIEASSGITVHGPAWLLGARGLYLAAIVVAALAYVACWNVLRSRTGRAITALSDNPYAAAAVGISSTRNRLGVFVLSGLITGVGGAIFLYYSQTVTPEAFPLDLSLAFLTTMVLGGSRSIGGSVLGAGIIGLLPQVLKVFPNQIGSIDVQNSIYGIDALLLLVCLRYFPEGLWNLAMRGRDRLFGDREE